MPAIRLRDVSVEFQVLSADSTSFRAQLVNVGSGGLLKKDARDNVSVLALGGLNLRIGTGDRIGLVGRNGAGKSTLLRLLAGIIAPTSGHVSVDGTIAALLGSTLGLDDDLTGHEAIHFGCMLMGLSRHDAKRAAPEIAEFTELGDYLAMPVRTYSSGMRLRLSFAIATCREPDILLVDEMIGAGDAHFVEKAKKRATEFMGRSSIVVLASHSEDIVRTVCNKAVYLDRGRVVIAGDVEEVLQAYRDSEVAGGRRAVSLPPAARAVSDVDPASDDAGRAFDGQLATYWRSRDQGDGVVGRAAIGLDLGEGQVHEFHGFTIRQWHGGDLPTMIGRVRVEASDDAFRDDVRHIDTVAVSPSIHRATYAIAASRPSRFWRLVAAVPTGGGPWCVGELELLGADSDKLFATNKGRPFSSGHTSAHGPRFAFDGWHDTFWSSIARGDDVQGNAYLGYDFGPHRPVEIRRFKLRQWDGGARPNTVFSVRVQFGPDAFETEIYEAGAILVPQDTRAHTHHLPPTAPARYWRILANSPTGGGTWGVSELEFSEQSEPNADPSLSAPLPEGRAISSPHFRDNIAGRAFDGEAGSHWVSLDVGPYVVETSYIGYDFGQGQAIHIRRVVIEQWNSGAPPNLVDSVLVQSSDDGFASDVTTVCALHIGRLTMRVPHDLPPSRPARYWRLLANASTGPGDGRWGVTHVEFWDETARRAGKPPAVP